MAECPKCGASVMDWENAYRILSDKADELEKEVRVLRAGLRDNAAKEENDG